MSQDKERELLPCPFCGSKEVSVANEEPHDNSGGYFIFCGECGASTNLRFAHGDDPVPLLREQWNRRAALASQPQATEPVAWMHPDGRVVAIYGYRLTPSGIRASVSEDGGKTWGPELIVRDDGGSWDLGYPNAWHVEGNRVGTLYYFNSKDDKVQANGGVRHIARSIFTID